MKTITKAAVISDLHLGEEESFLHALGDAQPKANYNLESIQAVLASEGLLDELILLGDFLDLSVAPFHDAVLVAKHFLRKALKGTQVGEIYFIPGNHDHHLWVEVVEQVEVVEKIADGGFPVGQPAYIDRFVDERLSDTYISGLFPEDVESPPLIVKYPHHLRVCGQTHYLFFHGHFLEEAFTPLNVILKPGRLAELEAFNTLWLEALWYYAGQAGPLSERVERLYDEFRAGRTEELDRLLGRAVPVLLERFGNPWWAPPALVKWLLKRLLGRFQPRRRAGLAGRELDGHQRDRIADYIDSYVLERYTPELGFTKPIPRPFTFVYGHTHRPHRGHSVMVKGEDYPLINTGGWLRSDAPDGSTTGILIIEAAGPRWESFRGRLR